MPFYTNPGFDAGTELYVRFDEALGATAFKNEVTGTNDMNTGAGTVKSGCIGPYGSPGSAASPGGSSWVGADAGRIVSANGAFEASNTLLTMCGWWKMVDRPGAAVYANLISKTFRPTTWTAPNLVAGLYTLPLSGTGGLEFNVYVSGVSKAVSWANYGALPLGEWVMIAGTYDGSNLRLYLNGSLVSTTPAPGTITWSTGGNASPWILGTPQAAGATAQYQSYIGPCWVESVCRSAAELLTRYQAGAKRY
jgi:hypothetical protein